MAIIKRACGHREEVGEVSNRGKARLQARVCSQCLQREIEWRDRYPSTDVLDSLSRYGEAVSRERLP